MTVMTILSLYSSNKVKNSQVMLIICPRMTFSLEFKPLSERRAQEIWYRDSVYG